jgi:spore coat protein U-like protein
MSFNGKSKLIVLAALVIALAIPAFSDTSATLYLSGTVAKSASISVTTALGASSLNLLSTPASAITVGTLNEICNSTSGYTVSVQSANAGSLKGAISGNTDTVPYSFYQNGTAVTLSATATNMITASSKTTGASQTLTINFTGNSALTADVYSDTLTFTIAAL